MKSILKNFGGKYKSNIILKYFSNSLGDGYIKQYEENMKILNETSLI